MYPNIYEPDYKQRCTDVIEMLGGVHATLRLIYPVAELSVSKLEGHVDVRIVARPELAKGSPSLRYVKHLIVSVVVLSSELGYYVNIRGDSVNVSGEFFDLEKLETFIYERIAKDE